MAAVSGHAQAATNTQITDRSLTLEAGASDGGSKPGGTVKHKFNFTLNNITDALGSISFQYCTTAAPVLSGVGCIAPTGMDLTSASLINSTGLSGFGATPATASVCDAACGVTNTMTISRVSASTIGGSPVAAMFEFDSVVNPGSNNTTFFVRITTHSSLDGTGVNNDKGTVAASTANPIILNGTMPESLIFCTGRTITETNNVPDCSTADTSQIFFNQLFSPISASWASSQMAASTNAGQGYVITVNGPTLTSGSNTIAPIQVASGDNSKPGTPQFGMNLVYDDRVPVISPLSANVTTPTGGSTYHGQALSPYATGDSNGDSTLDAHYYYNSGDAVANSNTQASDPQVFTVTYLANVPGSQPAGDYTTTLTYICTPTF